jgi:glycosyltransferase involved in cell wall biosynthesis
VKLTVVTNEPPFPAKHGGRVDVWRRLQAFAAHNVDIQLIYWYTPDDKFDAATNRTLETVCRSITPIPISRSFSSRIATAARLPFAPGYVAARAISRSRMSAIAREFEAFDPAAIWLDALFGADLAIELSGTYDKPLFYRSQNIEFQYRQNQFERAVNARAKLAAWMAKFRLRSFEHRVFERADFIWDISTDDMNYWRSKGFENIDWLPPFVDPDLIDEMSCPTAVPEYDFVYLGNLYTPNNIEGMRWFLSDVWPRVRADDDTRLLVAGSDPDPVVRSICRTEGVTLEANVECVAEVYKKAKVLINPILSGSGVNVKSVEMLFSGKPVVTTSQGVAGLPENIREQFRKADVAPEFARACLEAMRNGPAADERSGLEIFTFEGIRPVISRMSSIIDERTCSK